MDPSDSLDKQVNRGENLLENSLVGSRGHLKPLQDAPVHRRAANFFDGRHWFHVSATSKSQNRVSHGP